MNDINSIITSTSYHYPFGYISGRIVEYDMIKANISVLRYADIISQEQYDYLKRLPKQLREKEIGLMELKDYTLYQRKASLINEFKLQFAKLNALKDYEVIRVANDAIYVNRPMDLEYTKMNEFVEFRTGEPWDVYIGMKDLEIFYRYHQNNNVLDIKGVNDNSLYLHNEDGMLNIFTNVIIYMERSSIDYAIEYLSDMIKQYVARQLPINYYREFNSRSMFHIVVNGISYYVLDGSRLNPNEIEIDYNLYILRELWGIITSIYNQNQRRRL